MTLNLQAKLALVLFVLNAMGGCYKSRDTNTGEVNSISWEGRNIQDASFWVNDSYIGSGDQAFREILRRLEFSKGGRLIKVYTPLSDLVAVTEKWGECMLPFAGDDQKEKMFDDLAQKKQFSFSHETIHSTDPHQLKRK
jgi:hypothetical protein